MRDSKTDSLALQLTALSKLDKRHCVPLKYAISLLWSIVPRPAIVGVGSRFLAVPGVGLLKPRTF